MSFTDLAAKLDQACIDTFGVTANLYPQTQPETAVPITGIFSTPSMLEEIAPGFGVAVIRFFVRQQDITPQPNHGDQLEVNSVRYDVYEAETDAVGGCTLKLRIKG